MFHNFWAADFLPSFDIFVGAEHNNSYIYFVSVHPYFQNLLYKFVHDDLDSDVDSVVGEEINLFQDKRIHFLEEM